MSGHIQMRREDVGRSDSHEKQAARQGADIHDAVLELDGNAA
jgi:hypothetical protein